jgi:hypothetical protein
MPLRDYGSEYARACVVWADGRVGVGPWREPLDAKAEVAVLARSPRIRHVWLESESDLAAGQARAELEEDGYVSAKGFRGLVRISTNLRSEVDLPDDVFSLQEEPEWDDEHTWEEVTDDGIERPEE